MCMYFVWWYNVLPDTSFWQAVFRHWLPGLTCQILRLKEKFLDINIPKQQFGKTKANRQYWCVNTPLSKFQYFRALKIITQFWTGAKRTETVRTDYEDASWRLEIGNNSTRTLNSNLLTNWRWIHATISQRVNFRKGCEAPVRISSLCMLFQCVLCLSGIVLRRYVRYCVTWLYTCTCTYYLSM